MESNQNRHNMLSGYDAHIHAGLERPELGSLHDGLQVVPPNFVGPGFKPSGDAQGSRLSPDGETWAQLSTDQSADSPKKYYVLKAKTVWIAIIILLLALTAIGVGVGLGVTRNSASSANSTAPTNVNPTSGSAAFSQAASTNAASTTTTTTTTTTFSSTSSASAPSASVVNGGCNNGTTFTATDPNNTAFREYCNTDLNVGEGFFTTAIDLGSRKTNSGYFEECMQECALYRSQLPVPGVNGTCLSVTWVASSSTCYLKNATILVDQSNKTEAAMLVRPRNMTGLHSAEVIDT